MSAVLVRQVARFIGTASLIWLLAAISTAAFLPRGSGLNNQDQWYLVSAGAVGAVLIILLGVAACLGIGYLLRYELDGPLLLSAVGLVVLALVLPSGLLLFFLPPPVGLLISGGLLRAFPER